MRFWVVLAFILLLSGCASDAKRVLKFDLADTPRATKVIFPSVADGQTPRYLYVGDLVGEQNLVLANPADESTLMKVLKWIAGIFDDPAKMLVRPQGVAVDGQGRILVSDVAKNAIYVFDEPNGRLDIWEYATRINRFASPSGIAIGPMGRIFVADADLASVFLLDPQGNSVQLIGAEQLERPTGLAFDADAAELYVSDTGDHRIKVFDVTGRQLRTLGERGIEPGQFNYPTFIALRENKLVVADTLNARVQVLTLDGSAPPLVIGRRGTYYGDFVRPKGVGFGDDGTIYAVESYHDHLLVFSERGEFLLPIGGTGKAAGRFFLPSGMWVDQGSRVFVADTFNGRVAVFQYLGGGEDE